MPGLTLFAIQPTGCRRLVGQHVPRLASENPWFSVKYGPAISYPLFLAFFF